MRTLLNKISTLFHKYKIINRRLNKVTTAWTTIKSVVFSTIISLLIVVLPVALVINMFIYTKLTFILSVILVLLVMTFIYLYYRFYFILLSNYHEEVKAINTKYVYWVETSVINFIILLIGIAVLSLLF